MGIINYSHFAMKTFVPLVAIFAIIAIGQQASAKSVRFSLKCTKFNHGVDNVTHYYTLYDRGNGMCELQTRTEVCLVDGGHCGESYLDPERGDCSSFDSWLNNDYCTKLFS